MKNLTRVLALVLVFSLILSTVAFAAFTDVKDTDDYAEAIETLAGLDILKGYEDGTFGADKAITRAEAVAIVNRIQNLSAAATGAAGASLYTDVAADHWALGDINLATQMGTVSGDGNGMFRPEDQVSYQEMVKMLVVALGYQPAAADKGGWPTGYLVVASQYGVLDDTTNGGAAPATRGVVAQLTFNALTAPMMEQTGYGNDKTYEVKDVAGSRKTLLTEKLSIYKVDVTPVADDSTALTGSTVDVGKVKVEIDMNKSTVRSDSDAFYGVKLPFALDAATNATTGEGKTGQTWLAGDSEIGSSLGYQAVAYIKKNADKDWEVLFSTVDASKTRVFDIDPSTVDSIDTAKKQIRVKDDDIKLDDKYDYDTNTKVILNGTSVPLAMTVFQNTTDPNYAIEGTVTFVMNGTADDVVDYIFVNSYKTDRVIDESTSGKNIIMDNGIINLDTKDNKKLVYTLTLDGKDATPADLKENDIVTYREGNNKNFYEIIVTRETVEGTVDSTYVEDGVTYYEIGGKDYEPSTSGLELGLTQVSGDLQVKNVKIGTGGVFYLDAFGKIAYFEKTTHAAADLNYAYVINKAVSNDTFDVKGQIKLMTTDGKVDTYNFANKVTVIVNSISGNNVVEDDSTYSSVTAVVDVDTDGDGIADAKDLHAGIKNYVNNGDLVDITKNSSGEISTITVWNGAVASKGDDSSFTKNFAAASGRYNERTGKLGSFIITDNTVVFYVYGTDEDEYEVNDSAFFEDDTPYTYAVYGAEDGSVGVEAGAVVVTSNVTTQSERANIAVFVKKSTIKNAEGTKINRLEFYQNGELKTMDCESDSVANNLKAGYIFEYSKNAKGEITSVDGVNTATKDYVYPTGAASNAIKYVFGHVYDKSGTSLRIGEISAAGLDDTHKIPSDVAVYVVDYSGSKVKVSLGSITESVYKNRFYTDKSTGVEVKKLASEDDSDNYLVALKYKGEDVIGVVVYKNAIDVDRTNANGRLITKDVLSFGTK